MASNSPARLAGPQSPRSLLSLVETVLDIEQLEDNLFRGTRLWKPVMARAVFGGQVIAQSLMACARTVDLNRFAVHSLHSYFLLGGDHKHPIIYHVDRVRDGASYVTRTCNAVQKGRAIFSCMVSFHSVNEVASTEHAAEMPTANVPAPESLPDERSRLQAILDDPRLPEQYRGFVQKQIEQSTPIDLRYCRKNDPLVPTPEEPKQLVWLKAHGRLSDHPAIGHGHDAATDTEAAGANANSRGGGSSSETTVSSASSPSSSSLPLPTGFALALHQCIAAYASDFSLLGTALLPHGSPNPFVSMMASIDHSMWFHHPFRADDWLLYELESPRLAHGRGFCTGRLFSRDGTLVVSTAQEGVVRFSYDKPQRSIAPSSGSAAAAGSSSSAAGASTGVNGLKMSNDTADGDDDGGPKSSPFAIAAKADPTRGSAAAVPKTQQQPGARASERPAPPFADATSAPSVPSGKPGVAGATQPLFTWGTGRRPSPVATTSTAAGGPAAASVPAATAATRLGAATAGAGQPQQQLHPRGRMHARL